MTKDHIARHHEELIRHMEESGLLIPLTTMLRKLLEDPLLKHTLDSVLSPQNLTKH